MRRTSNKKQPSDKKETDRENPWYKNASVIIAFLSLIVSIMAIYFSSQSNRIAKEANKIIEREYKAIPVIYIEETKFIFLQYIKYQDNPINEDDFGKKELCSTRFRVANLGGVSEIISSWEIDANYGNENVKKESEQSYVYGNDLLPLFSRDRRFISLTRSEYRELPDYPYEVPSEIAIQAPYTIESYSVIDIYLNVYHEHVNDKEFEPLTIQVKFNFIDGQSLSSSLIDCNSKIRCGDNMCMSNETIAICPQDCSINNPLIIGYCGDGFCNNFESFNTCSSDCAYLFVQ